MTAPFQPEAGTLFGAEFRILRPLSAGGMGAVYVAEQASTGKLRALKLMHPQLVADAKLRERFVQEARVGALIASDHVVQVIGAGVDQATGVPWLAMELLEGEALSARLRRGELFSPAELYDVFRQLCHALGAAHRAGVVHRDLKPENLFLARTQSATGPSSVKVLDFGIAKVAAEASTTSTASLGTPLWMAPEQTEARGLIAPATDVWALGLIAFTMLTGRVYWRVANDPGSSSMTVLLREILLEPMDPASVRAAALGRAGYVPPSFDAWFERCVARELSTRIGSAQDAFDALGPALFGGGTGPVAASAYAVAHPPSAPSFSPTAPTTPLGHPASPAFPQAHAGSMAPTPPGFASAPPGFASAPPGFASAPPGFASAPPAFAPAPPAFAPAPPAFASAQPGFATAPTAPAGAVSAPWMAGAQPASTGGAPASTKAAAPRRAGKGAALVVVGVLLGAGALAMLLALFAGSPDRAPAPTQREIEPARPVATPSFATPQSGTAPSAEIEAKTPVAPLMPLMPGPVAVPVARKGKSEAAPPSPASPAAAPRSQASASAPPRPFDAAAAHASLQKQGALAPIHCKGNSGPKAVTVTVLFSPAGNVQRMSVNPMIGATESALCVQRLLGSARVPPFDGDRLESVTTTVGIE